MNSEESRNLRLEVEELTAILRSAETLRGLREALLAEGLSPEAVLLAGFVEDEEENECGAIVTPDGRVYTYERSTASSNAAVRVSGVSGVAPRKFPLERPDRKLSRSDSSYQG
jgi:hypothetical protein